ncbi:hypothetical protein IV417_17905 [Alphaproteobacteria bacterium KMM 3653]|uniref:Uncharacterized protein n=1 Tax=Harenicola maris TaxID=2841044 RepID=A0AAP2CU18_9RHOB|nr:hypothetical protein [Harenicola maris]
MSTLLNSHLGGAKFPVALVLTLTAVALTATPMVEARLTDSMNATFAKTFDPGSVEFVKAQ